MIPFRKSLGFRLLCITFILLATPLLVDAFIFLDKRYERVLERTKKHLGDELTRRTLPFIEFQENIDKMFSMLVYFMKLGEGLKEESPTFDKRLEELALINHYEGIVIAKRSEDDRYISVGSNLEKYRGKDVTEEFDYPDPYSLKARHRGYVLSFIEGDEKGSPLFVQTRGIYDAGGIPIGLISVFIDMDKEIDFLLRADAQPFETNFALLLPSSVVLAASKPDLLYHDFHDLSPLELKEFQEIEQGGEPLKGSIKLEKSSNRPYIDFKWEEKEHIGLVKALPGTDLSLLVYACVDDVIGAPFYAFLWNYMSYLVVFSIGFVIAIFGTIRLTRPIGKLSVVMESIEKGDLKKRYTPDPLGFEINLFGNVFNEMVDNLIDKEKKAEEERTIKELISKELRLGQKVQRSLLPQTLPKIASVDLAQAFVPAIEVGGDFFDAYVKENGKLVLSVADASGKGVKACCYSLSLKNMLRTYAKNDDDMATVSLLTNNLFCQDTGDSGMFVTVLIAEYDPHTRDFSYYSSGHTPVIHYRKKDKSVHTLDFLDMPMGVLHKERVEKMRHIQLDVGDLIVLYSDGVTEAHNPENELFGDARLLKFVEQEAHRSAEEFIERLLADLALFSGVAKQHDDITMLVMKVI
ncbi:MAG: hypothetical protein S4CHLAM45_10500 [Chlamydiales bacterium]|nr:hypothetical protein [Chlamydiales bacterium]MCH9619544.1 hypothetical protein [Chlamydiales bacterium]MCH9623150.1 hypothetical protein [Chlamydiales bacterium]